MKQRKIPSGHEYGATSGRDDGKFDFDDCPICQAMRDGRADTMEGILAAFRETKRKYPDRTFISKDMKHRSIRGRHQPDEHDLYYDAMDLLHDGHPTKAKKLLLHAVELNPESVEAYVGLTTVYSQLGRLRQEQACTDLAFDLTKKKFRTWPKRLPWGFIDNRQYLRAIQNKASAYHQADERESAVVLYRLLLQLNPNDNQGNRYLLAGLYAGLTPDEVDDYMDEGNAKQDWRKIEKLLDIQNAKRHFWKEPKDTE